MAWTNLDAWSVPLRAPFVVDVTEPTFRLVAFKLKKAVVCDLYLLCINTMLLSFTLLPLLPSFSISLSIAALKCNYEERFFIYTFSYVLLLFWSLSICTRYPLSFSYSLSIAALKCNYEESCYSLFNFFSCITTILISLTLFPFVPVIHSLSRTLCLLLLCFTAHFALVTITVSPDRVY